jgi:hypothetical protein
MNRTIILLSLAAGSLLAQSNAPVKRWWQKEPLRIIDVTSSIDRVGTVPPAQLAEWKAKSGFNSEHLEIMEMQGGLDDQGFFFQSKLAGRVNPDYLRQYIVEAHKRGIRVLIYFNVHWYKTAFGARHPEWRQITESGKPLEGVYDNGTDLCLNTPWREWCFQVLRDLAAYGVDGVFYDGPVYRANTCYCDHCRAKYRKLHGEEMPSKQVRAGAQFKRLLDFQVASMAEYFRDSNKVLKSISPDIAFYVNGGVRGANWATARINRELVEYQDLLGSEGGFISGDLTRVPLWKPGLTARMLETQAGGKPTVIFTAAAHKPWTFSLLPKPELRLLYADTIANAASVWMGLSPFDLKQPEMEAIAGMNRFVEKNGSYYVGTRSEARVAVVWSETTANFYSGSPAQMIDIDRVQSRSAVGNVDQEFSGISEALLRAHVPFDVIDDVTLEREPLERYAAIFLPNVACMNDKSAARLKAYVEKGGNLFATFETSLYDDTGIRRDNFALASLFGVAAGVRIAGPRNWDFMKGVSSHWLLEGIDREFLPSPVYYVQVKPDGAEVPVRFTVPLKGRYDGVPALSPDPAVAVKQSGKGTVIYVAGDFGNTLASFRLPEFLAMAANAARRLAPLPVTVDNVPGSVEVVWRSQNDGRRKLLHLVNFTGEMTRPITRVLPALNVPVTLPKGVLATKAFTLMRPQTLPISKDKEGRVRVTVPRVDEYEVVVFEQ